MGDSSLSNRCKPPYSLQLRACPQRSAVIHIFPLEDGERGGKTDRGGKLFISRSMEMDIVLSRGGIIKCASCRNEFFLTGWFPVCREESVRDKGRKEGQICEGLLIKTN